MMRFKSFIFPTTCISCSLNTVKEIYRRSYTQNSIKHNAKKKVGTFGWFLFFIPVTTFGLGTWQVQRKKWKENLITDLSTRSTAKPIELPEDLSELNNLEYFPIHVRGTFLHDKELYMGPRSLLKDGESASAGGLMTKGQNTNVGYLVVTPFQLADRGVTILVNRGWIPQKNKNPITRAEGQVSSERDIVGILRSNETRPNFIPANRPENNTWFYRDLEMMARKTDSLPIFLDIVEECDVEGGPLGGQTRINLRNEHLSYIITWYSLCALTTIMWYKQFFKLLVK